MLGFSGWTLAIPAAIALTVAWRTRPDTRHPGATARAPPPARVDICISHM